MHKLATFSLIQQTIDILDKISEKTGLQKSDIVRRAIEDYWMKIDEKTNS